jgi:hypothetical protein
MHSAPGAGARSFPRNCPYHVGYSFGGLIAFLALGPFPAGIAQL